MNRGAIFDLDGTLADTSGDLIAAANAALARMGAAGRLDPARDAAVAGTGGRGMLRLGLERSGADWTEADVDAAFVPFLADYEAMIADATRLYPGVHAALDALEADGWRLGVCTNKPERLARLLLERLGALDRFAALIGADTLPVRKPDPAPVLETARRMGVAAGRSVMIGDTVTDRDAARNAGVRCVLVAFGYAAEPLDALSPDAVARSFADLPDLLSRLAPPRG